MPHGQLQVSHIVSGSGVNAMLARRAAPDPTLPASPPVRQHVVPPRRASLQQELLHQRDRAAPARVFPAARLAGATPAPSARGRLPFPTARAPSRGRRGRPTAAQQQHPGGRAALAGGRLGVQPGVPPNRAATEPLRPAPSPQLTRLSPAGALIRRSSTSPRPEAISPLHSSLVYLRPPTRSSRGCFQGSPPSNLLSPEEAGLSQPGGWLFWAVFVRVLTWCGLRGVVAFAVGVGGCVVGVALGRVFQAGGGGESNDRTLTGRRVLGVVRLEVRSVVGKPRDYQCKYRIQIRTILCAILSRTR